MPPAPERVAPPLRPTVPPLRSSTAPVPPALPAPRAYAPNADTFSGNPERSLPPPPGRPADPFATAPSSASHPAQICWSGIHESKIGKLPPPLDSSCAQTGRPSPCSVRPRHPWLRELRGHGGGSGKRVG